MIRSTSRVAVSRLVTTTALFVVAALTVAGCAGRKARSAEEWLADQPFVLGVEILDSEVDDLSYTAVMRAELDPLATTDDIEKLISATITEVKPDDEVGVQFGILGLDFDVTTRSETAEAFALWRDIDDVPGIDSALVLSDFIYAHAPRETMVPVFDELADFAVGLRLDGDQADIESPVALVRPRECEPPAGARELAEAETANAAVRFATYDLCEGFDVVYANGTVFDATIGGMLGALDAAGLGAFPVRLAVAPSTSASPDYHIVEITPGAREAIAIVTALDASALAMRYELFAPTADGEPRALTIESSEATLEELHAVLAASPASAFLGELTITAADGEFEGDLADLADEVTPAPTRSPTPSPTPTP
jgi:hypothetical protein